MSKNERKKLIRIEMKEKIKQFYNDPEKRKLVQPFLNLDEFKEKLIEKKETMKEESEERKEKLREIGLKNYNFEAIHRKHTNSIVFSNYNQITSVLKFLFKFLFQINFSKPV
eukprot:gene7716-12186_t